MLRKGAPAVRELGEGGVLGLQIEKGGLGGGISFHRAYRTGQATPASAAAEAEHPRTSMAQCSEFLLDGVDTGDLADAFELGSRIDQRSGIRDQFDHSLTNLR